MSGSVLIVDDSLTVRMDLAEAFEAAGFRPLPCANAREAREALSREPVAVAVLDVMLPDADGLELLAELRGRPATRELPIVLLSSEKEVGDRIRGLRTGADDYVGKPYNVDYLIARCRELVRRRSRRVPASRPAVLVVDDSTTFREELRGAFERAGYDVSTASTGEEGLRLAADLRPAAIVVDGVMPGIDGMTFLRKVRLDTALRGTPCLLLTASDDGDAELRALDAGADAFVRKTEDLEVILARLAAVLRSATGQRPEAASLVGPRRVLVVDDGATYREELAGLLRGEGYEVILGRSGEEAIEMVAVQAVDCLLLDLHLPGLDGLETCRRLKASPVTRHLPVVLLAAGEERAALIDGLGAGADDFLSKSSEPGVLLARVQAQIRRKQFEDESRRVREALLRSELRAAEERAARELAETRAALVEELERKNNELEAFSYSVSHDLRAPLRSIDGFSQALLEDYAGVLDEKGRDYLQRVRTSAQRMAELIDDLLQLARVSRAELHPDRVNLSAIARAVAEELQRREPERTVSFHIEPVADRSGDSRLLRVLLGNLIGNAWKFSAKAGDARIEFGAEKNGDETVYFVRDNGAGFDMTYADKLFRPFQRLHGEDEFPGTGIGLATVQRIVDRHGGRVWARGEVGRGATIYFTIGSRRFGGGET